MHPQRLPTSESQQAKQLRKISTAKQSCSTSHTHAASELGPFPVIWNSFIFPTYTTAQMSFVVVVVVFNASIADVSNCEKRIGLLTTDSEKKCGRHFVQK